LDLTKVLTLQQRLPFYMLASKSALKHQTEKHTIK
jgi:hypothetical protein